MEPLRTVLFIDGRNFKYNLQAFRFLPSEGESNRYYALDEKHFLWQNFFLGIIEKFNNTTKYEHRLVRVYWYNAERMRPFQIIERLIESTLEEYRKHYPSLNREDVVFLAKEWYKREREYFDRAREQVYEGIQRKTDFLEFKYTGEYVVQPFNVYKFEQKEDGKFFYQGTKVGEKGVDVGIAVDMVAKMPNYDVAVLVSGDADFLPVVCYLKDNLKYVYQFSIAKGIPPRINYLSPWLKGFVDVFESFDELELLETYLNRSSGIPDIILQTIDQRIEELKSLQTQLQGNKNPAPYQYRYNKTAGGQDWKDKADR